MKKWILGTMLMMSSAHAGPDRVGENVNRVEKDDKTIEMQVAALTDVCLDVGAIETDSEGTVWKVYADTSATCVGFRQHMRKMAISQPFIITSSLKKYETHLIYTFPKNQMELLENRPNKILAKRLDPHGESIAKSFKAMTPEEQEKVLKSIQNYPQMQEALQNALKTYPNN